MSIATIARGVSSWVRKNPVTTAAIVGGGVGLVVGLAEMTKTKKQQVESMNNMTLANPILNPFGWMVHAFNPNSQEVSALDSPIVKYLVDRNNKNYQEYYDNLPQSDKVAEFYKNGGKGVTF